MSITIRIIAVLLVINGGIWMLQGFNVLPGSFMTGQIKWAGYGAASAIAGVVMFMLARRR